MATKRTKERIAQLDKQFFSACRSMVSNSRESEKFLRSLSAALTVASKGCSDFADSLAGTRKVFQMAERGRDQFVMGEAKR